MNYDLFTDVELAAQEDDPLMAALPHMPFFPADYLADTQHLSTTEHGAYLLLIFAYWMRGEPLPLDDKRLARITRLPDGEWMEMRETIFEFFRVDGDVLVHPRIAEDLEKVAAKVEQARNAGRASVQRRSSVRSTDVETDVQATDETDAPTIQSQSQSQTSPNGDGSLSGKPRKKPATRLPEDFEPILTPAAQANWNALEHPVRELAKFKDHALANDRRAVDWQAAFRTWLSKAVDYQQEKRNGRTGKRSAWLG